MRNLLFFLFLLCCCYGCPLLNDKPRNKDREIPFYKKKVMIGRGMNIPLIKPYSAIENENIRVWTIDLFNNEPTKYNESLQTKIAIIDSLNIIDSAIIAKCSNGYCSYGGEKGEELYYVIIPISKVEKAFFSYGEFVDYWKKINTKPPVFYSAYVLYEKWKTEDTLIWGRIDSTYERKLD